MRTNLITDALDFKKTFSPVELAERYGSWSGFRSNHVVDQDGHFFDERGSSRGISNETDRQLLIALRAKSDVVIVDASTARSEKYLGLRDKTLAIISQSGSFHSIPAVETSKTKVILLVPSEILEATKFSYERENLEVLGFNPMSVFPSIRNVLNEHGHNQLLLETGPTLTGLAIKEGQLSQACVTQTFRSKSVDPKDVRFPFGDIANQKNFQLIFTGLQEDSIYSLWEA